MCVHYVLQCWQLLIKNSSYFGFCNDLYSTLHPSLRYFLPSWQVWSFIVLKSLIFHAEVLTIIKGSQQEDNLHDDVALIWPDLLQSYLVMSWSAESQSQPQPEDIHCLTWFILEREILFISRNNAGLFIVPGPTTSLGPTSYPAMYQPPTRTQQLYF